VFAAARVYDAGRSVELVTDALGIAPLYFRQVGRLLLFATNPRLLALPGDRLDRLAAWTVVQSQFCWGDHGLTVGVRRVPPGSRLRFEQGKTRHFRWYPLSNLPDGREAVTRENLAELESAFQAAVGRLLDLKFGSIVLPLSGGNDSRRILAALVSREVAFEAYTVDTGDFDGPFATNLARCFRFPHKLLRLPTGRDFASIDYLRRVLADGECVEHSWWLRIAQEVGSAGVTLFDGLRGDVNPLTSYNSEKAIGTLSEHSQILEKSWWPSLTEVRNYLAHYLAIVPDGNNREHMTFTMTRTRFAPALMATRLLPVGNLAVFPFLDLEYLWHSLRFRPGGDANGRNSLQQVCLEEFWPQYASFPSTRALAPVRPRQPRGWSADWKARLEQLNAEAGYPGYGDLRDALTRSAWLLALAAPHSGAVATRVEWWLERILTIFARQAGQKPAWTVSE
jgi:hypothetical protein